MENEEEKLKGKEPEAEKCRMEEVEEEAKRLGKKSSKTWEAMKRLKGSLIVNDPKFLL